MKTKKRESYLLSKRVSGAECANYRYALQKRGLNVTMVNRPFTTLKPQVVAAFAKLEAMQKERKERRRNIAEEEEEEEKEPKKKKGKRAERAERAGLDRYLLRLNLKHKNYNNESGMDDVDESGMDDVDESEESDVDDGYKDEDDDVHVDDGDDGDKGEDNNWTTLVAAATDDKEDNTWMIKFWRDKAVEWEDKCNGWKGKCNGLELSIGECKKTALAQYDSAQQIQVEMHGFSQRLQKQNTWISIMKNKLKSKDEQLEAVQATLKATQAAAQAQLETSAKREKAIGSLKATLLSVITEDMCNLNQ